MKNLESNTIVTVLVIALLCFPLQEYYSVYNKVQIYKNNSIKCSHFTCEQNVSTW